MNIYKLLTEVPAVVYRDIIDSVIAKYGESKMIHAISFYQGSVCVDCSMHSDSCDFFTINFGADGKMQLEEHGKRVEKEEVEEEI